jgi:RNA polymerase sigma-70 factor (ECF subfamily)
MSARDTPDALLRQLQDGGSAVPEAAFRLFASRLIALARSRLSSRLRGKVDPEDVVQSAFRSFFGRWADGQFECTDPDSLWGLLVLFTLRKCYRQAERFRAERRDVRRETPLAHDEGPSSAGGAALTREPTPEQAVLLTDTVEQVMARLDTPLKRRVLEMTLQGYTVAEISAELRFYQRGVERIRSRVRDIVSQLSAEP